MADNYQCGWCGTLVPRSKIHIMKDLPGPKEGEKANWTVLACTACQRPTFLVETQSEMPIRVLRFLPAERHEKVDTKGAPEAVVADYAEAVDCLQIGAHKAAAAMARRAVQGMCIDLLGKLSEEALARAGSTKEQAEKMTGGILYDQIELLWSAGELTNLLYKVAHNVRVFGNYGAHPGDDLLEDLTEKDAKDAIRFLEHLLEHIFLLEEEEPTQV